MNDLPLRGATSLIARRPWACLGRPSGGQVDAFYKAAMAAGGRDNGSPSLTPEHGPTYYSAYVLDPDGHNIEVVCGAKK